MRHGAIVLAVLGLRVLAMLGTESDPDHSAEDDGTSLCVVTHRDHPQHGRSSEHDHTGP